MPVPSISIITCTDDFLLAAAAKEAAEALVPAEEREFGLEVVDGAVETLAAAAAALQSARAALSQTGLFAESKTVWLKNAVFLDTKRLSDSKAFAEKLEEFSDWLSFPGVPDGSHLLISAPAIPKNTRFFKALSALAGKGAAHIAALEPPNPKTAGALVRAFAKERGVDLPPSVAERIVARAGAAPRTLATELDKLLAYTNGAVPTAEDAEEICSAAVTGEFWDLSDAFAARNLRRAVRLAADLVASKVEPVFLAMMLEARLNELHLMADSIASGKLDASGRWSRSLRGDDALALARLGKLDPAAKNPWAASKLAAQAAKWRPAELRRARKAMNSAHERMVTISGVDPALILAHAIAESLAGAVK